MKTTVFFIKAGFIILVINGIFSGIALIISGDYNIFSVDWVNWTVKILFSLTAISFGISIINAIINER